MRPELSVVVPTSQGARRLPPLLDSLAEQDLDAAWELIVVLDGGRDDTTAVLERYRDRLPLRVMDTAGDGGVAAALREGYAAARGAVVVRCDDDLTLPPGLLAGHLDWHARGRRDGTRYGVVSVTRDLFADETPYVRAYGREANALLRAGAYARPAADAWLHWAACNSVAKADYDAVGGFDTSFTYREDSELGLRLADSGVVIVLDPLLEVTHRGAPTSARARMSRAVVSGAATAAFEARHPGRLPTARPARSLRARAYRGATVALSRVVRTQGGVARMGSALDAALPHLPRTLGARLVAVGVEAGALAGRRGAGRGAVWDRAAELREGVARHP